MPDKASRKIQEGKMLNKLGWSIMTLLAVAVASYALAMLLIPTIRSSFILSLFNAFPKLTWIHLFGGSIAMVTGAIQLNTSIREKYSSFHRLLGRLYVVAIFFSAIAAFVLALNSTGGSFTQTGFALLAIFWLTTTFFAYYFILRRKIVLHKNWMIRSYALTLAGVTLRVYLGASTLLSINFMDAYPFLAWLCWIPNLLIAELFLRINTKKHSNSRK